MSTRKDPYNWPYGAREFGATGIKLMFHSTQERDNYLHTLREETRSKRERK